MRVGIIGCGDHASENLMPALWAMHSVEIVAVCDNNPAALASAAQRFPLATTYNDFRELILNGGVEAIIVAATPQIHFEAASQAIHQGVHVFVEKPPTVTTGELSSLVVFAAEAGVVTGVGHNLRHATASKELRRRIAEQSFGTPVCMDMRYFASKPLGDRWNLKSVLRSFLLSHANHALDLMLFQMGETTSVGAMMARGLHDDAMTITVQLGFETGAVGSLVVTTCAPYFSVGVTVVGNKSTVIHLEGLDRIAEYGLGGEDKRWGRSWASRTLTSGYEHAGYQTELETFIGAIAGGAPMHPSFSDEIAVYKIMDEIEHQLVRSPVLVE